MSHVTIMSLSPTHSTAEVKMSRVLGSRLRGGSARRARAFIVDGNRLRLLRAARGWTQLEAALRAGLSERLLRKAESGGPLELQSIDILAQLYSAPARPLTANDLLVHQPPYSNTAETEAIVRRWYNELWNKGRLDILNDLLEPKATLHIQDDELDLAAAHRYFRALRAAFNDFDFVVDDVVVHDGVAAARWHVCLTHVGPWRGKPASGRRFRISGASWLRIERGRIQKGWDYWNQECVVGDVERDIAKTA